MTPSFQISLYQEIDDEALTELHGQLKEDPDFDQDFETFKSKVNLRAVSMSLSFDYDPETGGTMLTDESYDAW